MKKILITFVLSIIGFIGFLNAQFTSSMLYTGSCYGFGYNCSFDNLDYIDCKNSCDLFVKHDEITMSCGTVSGILTKSQISQMRCFQSSFGNVLGFSFGTSSPNGFVYYNSEYLPVSSLSSVVSSIFTVTGEIIPYVVYIGIGVLLVTLGFFAIKWLVNWLVNKITKYFK